MTRLITGGVAVGLGIEREVFTRATALEPVPAALACGAELQVKIRV